MANLIGGLANLLTGGPTEPVPPPINPNLGGAILSWIDKGSGQTLAVHFDVCSSEHHESTVEVTKHPVEEGVDVVDHARVEPDKITIEGYVSNKPLPSNLVAEYILVGNKDAINYMTGQSVPLKSFDAYSTQSIPSNTLLPTPGSLTRAVVGAIDGLLNPGPTSAFVAKASPDFPNRARATFIRLKEAQKARVRIRVTTAIEELDSMIITSLSVPRGAEDGNGANFSLNLEQIRTVTSELVDAPSPAEGRGAPSVKQGTKNAEKDPNKDGKRQTAAKNLAGKVFGYGTSGGGLLGGVLGP